MINDTCIIGDTHCTLLGRVGNGFSLTMMVSFRERGKVHHFEVCFHALNEKARILGE